MSSPFVWHELLTSDPVAASAFYAALFGWTVDGPTFLVDGGRVAGARASKIPPHWAPFVQVHDPEASALAAVAAGGRVAGRPSQPAGIVLLERGNPTVATAESGVDVFAWHILESTDPAASAAWLATIAGLSAPPGRGLWRGDAQVGSLVSGTHDRWLCLVHVDDRPATRARAIALGATVERADVDASGHGTYDVLLDPQGAAFCVFSASAGA